MPPPRADRTKFIADAMLGSLVRKLRALGCDASYWKSGDDSRLLSEALREGRIVLTGDRALASGAGRRGATGFLVSGRSDGARLRVVGETARSRGITLVRGEPLCSVCGGELKAVAKEDVTGKVPALVERRHRRFFVCTSCGKMYWKGSHWKKLRSLARQLEAS